MNTVFVSSTFRDMYFERDALQEYVLPMLDKEAQKYGRSVSFCDLRWGVDTADLEESSTYKKVLDVCFDEIDRSTSPMIIIVGERFGWIPPESTVKQISLQREIELSDLQTSITALEIEYGAFVKNRYSLIYFRENEGDYAPEWGSEDSFHKEKLELLKNRLCSLSNGRVKPYKMRFSNGAANQDDLKHFAQTVYEDVSEYLFRQWSCDSIEAGESNQRIMRSFIHEKASVFRARNAELDKLKTYMGRGERLILIKGDTGSGKSTFFSKAATVLRNSGWEVIPFVAGLTAESTTAEGVAAQLADFFHLEKQSDDHPDEPGIGVESDLSSDKLTLSLNTISSRIDDDKKYVIMIDAVDQLQDSDFRNEFKFIPKVLSDNLRVILTCTSDHDTRRIENSSATLTLSPLNAVDKSQVLCSILEAHHKELSDEVINAILSRKESSNPLYLSLMIQRLLIMNREDFVAIDRDGGNMKSILHRQLSIIEQTVDSVEEISAVLVSEAGKRFNPSLISKVCDYLAVSRFGLRVSDLERLCSDDWNYLDFAQMLAYMRDSFFVREDGRIDFVHKSLRLGLEKHIKNAPQIHREILKVLKDLDNNDALRQRELIYHCSQADDKSYLNYYVALCAAKLGEEYGKTAVGCLHDLCVSERKWICSWIDAADSYKYRNNIINIFAHHVAYRFSESARETEVMLEVYRHLAVLAEAAFQESKKDNQLGSLFLIYYALGRCAERASRAGFHTNALELKKNSGYSLDYFRTGRELIDRGLLSKRDQFWLYYRTVMFLKTTYRQEDVEKAISIAEEGLELGVDKAVEPIYAGALYGCMGELYGKLNQLSKREEMYRKDLELRKKGAEDDPTLDNLFLLSGAYYNVGTDLILSLKTTEGIEYLEKGIEIQENALDKLFASGVQPDESTLFYASSYYEQLTNAYISQSVESENRRYLKKAYETAMKSLTVYHRYCELFDNTSELYSKFDLLKSVVEEFKKCDDIYADALTDELIGAFETIIEQDRTRFRINSMGTSEKILEADSLGMIRIINAVCPSNPYVDKLKKVYCDTIIQNYSNKIKEKREKEDYEPDYSELFWLFNKSYYLSQLNEDVFDRESLDAVLECTHVIEYIHARDKDTKSNRFLIDVYAKTGMCYARIRDYKNALIYYKKALNTACSDTKENADNRIGYFGNYLNTVCVYLEVLQEKNDYPIMFEVCRDAIKLSAEIEIDKVSSVISLHSIVMCYCKLRLNKPYVEIDKKDKSVPDELSRTVTEDYRRLLKKEPFIRKTVESTVAYAETIKRTFPVSEAFHVSGKNISGVRIRYKDLDSCILILKAILEDSGLLLVHEEYRKNYDLMIEICQTAFTYFNYFRSVDFENDNHYSYMTFYKKLKEAKEKKHLQDLEKDNQPIFGIPDGYSKHSFYNGSVYEGEWKDGFCSGHGTMIYPDGKKYEGSFEFGKREGYGELTWDNGNSFYRGLWHDDLREGFGETESQNGFCYVGEWAKGKINGYGKKENNGSVIYGLWKSGSLQKETSKFTVNNCIKKYRKLIRKK